MSRQLRRRLERDHRRGINRTERVVSLPTLLDEFTVFDIPQRIFDQISNGSIDAVGETAVFRDNHGVLTEVVPALNGWIYTWEKFNEAMNMNLFLGDLAVISQSLQSNTLITQQMIDDAQATLTQCRQAFRICDRKEIAKIAKTAQIQIMLEGN